MSRGSGEYDQQEFAPPFVSELRGGGPRGELLAMVLVNPKKRAQADSDRPGFMNWQCCFG